MNYKELYYKHYGLDKCDIIYCILCNSVAVNLHHINYGKGLKNDNPENLAPLCYYCHTSHHNQNKPTTEEIKEAMLLNQPPF